MEHLKIETRLRGERFDNVKPVVSSMFRLIRRVTVLTRMCPTFDLICEEKTVTVMSLVVGLSKMNS